MGRMVALSITEPEQVPLDSLINQLKKKERSDLDNEETLTT